MVRKAKMKEEAERNFSIGAAYLEGFVAGHGHSRIPPGTTAQGLDIHYWWISIRASYHSGGLPADRLATLEQLAAMGADLRNEKEIRTEAAREKARQDTARKAAKTQGNQKTQRVEEERQQRNQQVLDALRAFAVRHGHTDIPPDTLTATGIPAGRFIDQWRRQHVSGTLNRSIARALTRIPHWSWHSTLPVPPPRAPVPVPIPEDTTLMKRPGLRQFLPSD